MKVQETIFDIFFYAHVLELLFQFNLSTSFLLLILILKYADKHCFSRRYVMNMWLKSKLTHFGILILKIIKVILKNKEIFIQTRAKLGSNREHPPSLENSRIFKTQLYSIVHKNFNNCQY